jgi:hypothetical protein
VALKQEGAEGLNGRPADLTCVHVNCNDSMLLASGYSNNVVVHDLATMQRSHLIVNAATSHINITRFSNMHPHVFATSSFDKSVALWDLRLSSGGSGIAGAAPTAAKPIYRIATRRGNVTLSFDPTDTLLLTSGVDNELQLLLVALYIALLLPLFLEPTLPHLITTILLLIAPFTMLLETQEMPREMQSKQLKSWPLKRKRN